MIPRFGIQINADLYAWGDPTDAASAAEQEAKAKASTVVNAIGLVFACGTFLWFFLDLLFGDAVDALATSAFWFGPSVGALLFFVSSIGFAFLFFRFSEASIKKTLMPLRAPGVSASAPVSVLGKRWKNIAPLCGRDARKTVDDAADLARDFGNRHIDAIHLFAAAIGSEEASVLFIRLGIPFSQVKDPLIRRLSSRETGEEEGLSEEGENVLLSAFADAFSNDMTYVTPMEILHQAFLRDAFAKELLYGLGVNEDRFANTVAWIRVSARMRERYERFRKAAVFKPTGPVNRSRTSVATPALDAVSEDLTTYSVQGRLPLLVERESEMETIFRVIEGGRQSVILVGSDGVGKTAMLSGIAERMVEERVPDILKDKRLVAISIPSLIAGATPAESQARLMAALADVARSRNVVLAIQHLEQLTGLTPGGEQTADLVAVLVDFLSRGFTFAIATTTPEAFASAIERTAFGRVFEKVTVSEPDTTSAIRIVESYIGGMEAEHGVLFLYEAVERAVGLSDRYIHDAFLPEKAIEICRETALVVAKERGKDALVSGEDVAKIVAEKTRIPLTRVEEDEREKLLHLEERMHDRIIGQEEAVKAVSAALRRARAELRSDHRPISTFLFLGPTGVGKTELAKTVAETYFGSEEAMIRFDMSEYQDPLAINKLIGAPDDRAGGQLSEAVRHHPFSIILLDELEKAHPDVLNIFLQVFDDGRLTDATGRVVDFSNTIIIATSNAAAEYIQDAVSAGTPIEQMKTRLLEVELRHIYHPEFLNRFDGIVVFRPLSLDDVEKIARLLMRSVSDRLEAKGIRFRASDEAVLALAQKGFDPKFGARPLRRVIQDEVDTAIADALLQGKVTRRDTVVLQPGGRLEIEKAQAL